MCIGAPEYRIELEDLAVGLRVVKREEKREKDLCATVERGCYTVICVLSRQPICGSAGDYWLLRGQIEDPLEILKEC